MVRTHHDGRRRVRGQVLKSQDSSKYGHQRVVLCDAEDNRCPRQVHQLVMLAFVGPCPPGMEVRHLDSNPRNNVLANLAYGTRAENARDRVLNGTDWNASKTNCPTCDLPYDEENTYWYKGARQCKNCRSRRSREGRVPSADLPPEKLELRRAQARERMRRFNERKARGGASGTGLPGAGCPV